MKKYFHRASVLFAINLSFAQPGYQPTAENLKNREWFLDAKFGLFVHWGVYSVLGNREWVMNQQQIPIKLYERLPSFFNPVDFNPAEWVAMVKKAGMKYITITSYHHDGFAMYDSKISNYDIVDRTPYKKDVLKILKEECDKQGIKVNPFPGEDFQMFERDLPGVNTMGFNQTGTISELPLEMCETRNGSWGFNMRDKNYKSSKQLIQTMVKAAGFGANFLLNTGPMPNGKIQPKNIDTLAVMGKWLEKYGETI